MRSHAIFLTLVLVLLGSFGCGSSRSDSAASPVAKVADEPTTSTLARETRINTSASSAMPPSTNGNAKPGNVSKVNVHDLLYPGHTTKIYVNYLPWFGTPSHINVGYDSADPAQVERQVDDMVSRGFDGAILDWFGVPVTVNTAQVDTSSALFLKSAERYPDFKVAIMMDHGALKACIETRGCDRNRKLIQDLTYAYQNYMQSPNYLKVNGRPAVYSFDLELKDINWKHVMASVPGNPIMIFRNATGFTRPYSGGSYSWVGRYQNPNDSSMEYFDRFYENAREHPNLQAMGSVYKGFNDNMAAWSLKRVQGQLCGQTWLNTFDAVNKWWNPSNQLDGIQVVTWNDYEEGTAIETGIDNCLTLQASVSDSTLSWKLVGKGKENTIDHYRVFISTDGQNVTELTQVPAGTHSINIGSYSLPAGKYTIYVKAVGKPSITNKMSNAVTYTRAAS